MTSKPKPDPFKNPLGTLKRLARQNPDMGLEIDYAHKLSPSELAFMVNFTLEQVGSRKHCVSEDIRREQTRLRGRLRQSDAMTKVVDLGVNEEGIQVTVEDILLPQVHASPETQAMYNQLRDRNILPAKKKLKKRIRTGSSPV